MSKPQVLISNRSLWVMMMLMLLCSAPHAAQAENATGRLTLSPSTGSYVVGSTYTIAVTVDSGAADVNAVQADLIYNPALLELVGIDTRSSAFDRKAIETGGDGKVSIVRTKQQTALTGSQLVGSVTFKVLAKSGNAVISFAPTSSIEESTTNRTIWDTNQFGGRYTMKAIGPVTHSSTNPSLETQPAKSVAEPKLTQKPLSTFDSNLLWYAALMVLIFIFAAIRATKSR
ncbi:MAG TPA: cohesin domain-containing protein [Candidatus Saccharimonadia bacterium]